MERDDTLEEAELDARQLEALEAEWPLRAAVRAALAVPEDAMGPGFGAELMAKIEAEVEASLAEASPAAGALLAEVEGELGRRTGEWSAFAAGVERRAREEGRAEARISLETRAIASLRGDVEAELEAVAPRFEGAFQADLDRRLASSEPDRSRAKIFRLADHPRWAVGIAAAAAALLLVLVRPFGLGSTSGPAGETVLPPPGEISVDDVSFEGNVTVMKDRGVAVIWLAEQS